MKSKKWIFFGIAAVFACICLMSCQSAKYVMDSAVSSDEMDVNESGIISYGKPGNNSEDIYITGYLDDRFGLNLLGEIIGINSKAFVFNGKVTIDEIEYSPSITIHASYNSSFDTRVSSLSHVEISNIADDVQIYNFEALGDSDLFYPPVKYSDMPYKISEFVTADGKFRVSETKYLARNEKGSGTQTPFEVFKTPEQLFQITDVQDNLVAEFDAYSYRIFSNNVDVDVMKLIIASYVIVGTVR